MTTVSAILFAYNQERYVQAAAESLLAQKGPAIEILFSDDCSTDHTFEILKKAVESYKGTHRVRLNRNSVNMGLMQHVQAAASMCVGDWIVMAAGDDVSSPERVEALMAVVAENPQVAGIASAFHYINEKGESLPSSNADNLRLAKMQDEPMPELMAAARKGRGTFMLTGAAAAWRRDVFTRFPPVPAGRDALEDCVLRWRAKMLGNLKVIPADLVAYRRHDESLTNWGQMSRADAEKRTIGVMRRSRDSWLQTVDDLKAALQMGIVTHHLYEDSMREAGRHIRYLDAFVDWYSYGLNRRIWALLRHLKSPLFRYGLRRLFSRSAARPTAN